MIRSAKIVGQGASQSKGMLVTIKGSLPLACGLYGVGGAYERDSFPMLQLALENQFNCILMNDALAR
jgi:hypothetical protein